MSGISEQENKPRHIGIIMDGNGRWAKSRGMDRPRGHQEGAKASRRIIDACQEIGIPYLTLYAFSAENWNRPQHEIDALMELLEAFLEQETQTLIDKKVRLHAIGRLAELPAGPRAALQKAMQATESFNDWHLTLALNYSSRNEVIDASKSLAQSVAAGELEPEAIDWERFADRLYTRGMPDPDLIIRTSGERRISNFLLMQSAYAEYYFTDVFWPDFDKEQLRRALDCYRGRQRRYGKTGEQLSEPVI